MSYFQKPTNGNKDRNMPINSVKNLQHWLNRQAKQRKIDEELK